MDKSRSIYLCHVRFFRVAASIAMALLLIAGTPIAALAIDCSAWSSVQGEERDRALEGAIDELLNSPRAAQWTTLNMPLIKACLLANRGRIQAGFDGLCAKGMQTSLEALDAKLLEYARGCVRA